MCCDAKKRRFVESGKPRDARAHEAGGRTFPYYDGSSWRAKVSSYTPDAHRSVSCNNPRGHHFPVMSGTPTLAVIVIQKIDCRVHRSRPNSGEQKGKNLLETGWRISDYRVLFKSPIRGTFFYRSLRRRRLAVTPAPCDFILSCESGAPVRSLTRDAKIDRIGYVYGITLAKSGNLAFSQEGDPAAIAAMSPAG